MLIRLNQPLHVGDGVEVENPDGGTGFGQAVEAMYLDGRPVQEAAAGALVAVPKKGWVVAGSKVNKTLDIILFTDAQLSYTDRQRRIGVSVRASLGAAGLVVTIGDDEGNTGVGSSPAETARGEGMTAEALKHQLKKLGDTPFKPRQFEIDVAPGVHVSLSQVNAARRAAVDALKQVRTSRYKRAPAALPAEDPSPGPAHVVDRPRLAVTVQGVKLTTAACENGADAVYYAGLDWGGDKDEWNLERMRESAEIARSHSVPFWIHFPYITRDADLEYIRTIMPSLAAMHPAGAVVGNLGALELVKEFGLKARADYPMNTYNSHALSVMKEMGFESACLSPEMTLAEMAAVAKESPIPIEAVSHGQLHLMVSEHCAIGAVEGCYTKGKHVPCRRHDYELVDEKGFRFQLVTDGKCRMHLMNSRELAMLNKLPDLVNAGIATLRMDTEGLKPDTVGPILRTYRTALDELILQRESYRFNDSLWEAMKANSSLPFTTGHFYRGVD
jgi:putative protease